MGLLHLSEPSHVYRVAISHQPVRFCSLPMVTHRDESHGSGRPEISALFERLSSDGRDWAEAELALARAELGELRNQAMRAALFAAMGFAAVFCAMSALSQAGIALLTPHVSSEGVAALIVFVALVLLVIASGLALRRSISWRTESIFFRWFGAGASRGGRA